MLMQDVKGQLNRFPPGVAVGVMATIKEGRAVFRRKDCVFLYFDDKAGVKVNVKQRSSERFCPSGTSCKEVGRPWSRNLAHPGLPAFCNSSAHL
ncbi:hypothetical protein E2I00_001843 [Balaenoptera physalus]|uniref:Uncharacterized protein n=1 Tax=Balaenoptera physalus TaxID=9770 RepID=A0A6A1QGL0_BALPH|nr:hypothetical protein E2I00_001843 [Balaenoptera physalus]